MKRILILVGIAASVQTSILANPMTFSSRTGFNDASGPTTLINFEAQIQGGSQQGYPLGLSIGNANFTQPEGKLLAVSPGVFATDVSYGNYLINNNGASGMGISFTVPVYTFGMDLGYIPLSGSGNSINLSFTTGANHTFGFELFPPNLPGEFFGSPNPFSFFGITSDEPISSISIVDGTHRLAIDNFTYSTTGTSRVPDSASTVVLLGGALTLLGVVRRKLA